MNGYIKTLDGNENVYTIVVVIHTKYPNNKLKNEIKV